MALERNTAEISLTYKKETLNSFIFQSLNDFEVFSMNPHVCMFVGLSVKMSLKDREVTLYMLLSCPWFIIGLISLDLLYSQIESKLINRI